MVMDTLARSNGEFAESKVWLFSAGILAHIAALVAVRVKDLGKPQGQTTFSPILAFAAPSASRCVLAASACRSTLGVRALSYGPR